MMRVLAHRAAQDELRSAVDLYFQIDPSLAAQLLDEFDAQVGRIQRNPEAARVRRYNVRRVNLRQFKSHYIAYMIFEEQIVIIALGHAKRRPYYWYRRPKEFRDNPDL